jgi:hypothetical protein
MEDLPDEPQSHRAARQTHRQVGMKSWQLLASLMAVTALAGCSAVSSPPTSSMRPDPTQGTSTQPTASATSNPRPGSIDLPIRSGTVATISSTNLTVGSPVTVSGSNCPAGNHVQVFLVQTAYPDDIPFNPSRGGQLPEGRFVEDGSYVVTADSAGRWTMTAPVPMVFGGPAILAAVCSVGYSSNQQDFQYPGVEVDVVSPALLTVAPGTTVKAGTMLTVSPVSTDCPSGSGAWAGLWKVGDARTSELQISVANVPNRSPGWPESLLVPPGLAPGQYEVAADCVVIDGPVGSFQPVIVTVG